MTRIVLFMLAVVLQSAHVAAQEPAVFVDVSVPVAPSPVKANSKVHLFYELHITNFLPAELELTGVDVYEHEPNTKLLASYRDAALVNALARPGAAANLPDKRVIAGGMRAILFVEVTVNSEAELPRSLCHRLFFRSAAANAAERTVDGVLVLIRRPVPIALSAPLRGGRWLAANGISNTSVHRRAILPVNGQARIAQRFATDWIQLGEDGRPFHGDAANNANWYGYGSVVLAVADATVIGVKDGIPENVPLSPQRAVPITLETLGGNYVLLDLRNGHSAFYAHLQPGSLRVKVGDKVKRGQALGLLGNSGNSDAPHLHVHVADADAPFAAEGVPTVLDSFELLGAVTSLDALLSGSGWNAQSAPQTRHLETPVENEVVRFR